MRLILAVLYLLGNSVIAWAAPTFPPGSRVGLVPAEGMVLSRRSGDFENPAKYASVRIKEMRPNEYRLLEKSIMKPDEKTFRVIFKERTMVGGHPAVLVTVNQTSQQGFLLRKWLLAVQEPTITMFVVVQSIDSPEGYSDVAVRRMLNSVVARPFVPIEAEMARLSFTIGDRAGFRPVRMSMNEIAFSEGSSDELHQFEQPVALISFTSMTPPRHSEEAAFAEKLLKADPELGRVVIKQSQSFQYRGRDRHEIQARAKDMTSGKTLIILQTLEFHGSGILRLKGVVQPGNGGPSLLQRFRSLADSIELSL
ncbi:MAG: hypothetical protein K0R61_1947 [Microvirga sp.]|jgi:hypothetical protein|nr:hypothetical protein [Microvirga sp.]